jgi:hypothetical protein
MNEQTPRGRLLDAIEATRTEAARLLDAADHETLKNFIQFALRELDKGAEMLDRKATPEHEPRILSTVDKQIHVARWRLKTVSWALHTYGPGAKLFDE